MNHIQNFYKNKCENLTEQLNYLKNQFNTLLTEKSRGFNVPQEQQNILFPPAWYTNHGLPNPWHAMTPQQRAKEWQRHLDYWTSMDAGTPGLQSAPNLPAWNPKGAGRSAADGIID